MTATLISGTALAARVREEVKAEARKLKERGVTPGLAVILVGDDPASHIYVKNKEKAAAEAGVETFDHRMPASTTQVELLGVVKKLNADGKVHGILCQLPLPSHIDSNVILDAISPDKDVDGFHADNIGRLAQGRPRFVAATPSGCMRLIAEAGVDPTGRQAVVVGRSNIVGKPMSLLLTNANATVTVCHSKTRDLPEVVRSAEILVAAIGKAKMIKGDWIRDGAVVIDVGMNRDENGKLCGDVDFEAAKTRARAITPVPGGVGPMTIACLLENTVKAARLATR
jgi:methylenetetrahydrofolate dehydrogenase (NADP+)/methenyltetrahydrofolate cyclohydrolase